MAQINNDEIQIAALADVETIIVMRDGSHHILPADPRMTVNENLIIDYLKSYQSQHNCDLAVALQGSMDFIRERTANTNTLGNRGVLNVWDSYNAPDESFAYYETFAAADVASIIMYTDGIDDRYGLFTHANLVRLSQKSSGFDELLASIRAVENADPLGEKYPRTKTSDDATIAYVQLVMA